VQLPLPFLIGVVLAGGGFVLLFGLLAKQGALSKSKQFAALSAMASGQAGAATRRWFFLAIAAMGLGTCSIFVGVGAKDAARRRACETTCKTRGYERGVIRGSTEESRGKHAFVACACEGGGETLELRADDLVR
jgi:hypothetical protein